MRNTAILVIMLLFLSAISQGENSSSGLSPDKSKNNEEKRGRQTDSEIPIMAWYSIPASETSVERYQEMRDAGINYSVTFFPNLDEVKKALDVAAKTDVKILASCPELKTETESTVKQLMNHPAIAGYHLKDEPGMDLYPELSTWAKKIRSIDNKHFCYVNLFPTFAGSKRLGTESYEEYVQEYINQIPIDFISFDFYPVYKDYVDKRWYKNLEIIAKKAKENEKPFWAFVLTTNYDDDHVTPQTIAAMRLQAFTNLAYGAQGIQYFTYWSATSTKNPSSEDQRGAPLSATGKRSVVYDRVKQMSKEIQNLSGVFKGAEVLSVRHTGLDEIPDGTVRLTELPEQVKVLDTHGSAAIVSVLQKKDTRFLVLVNKDHLKSMPFTYYGDDSVKIILKDGTEVSANLYDSSMELDPGDIAVFMFPVNN